MSVESSAILEESIDAQRESTDVQSVQKFVEGVEDRVKEAVDEMRDAFGESLSHVIGEAIGEARSFKQDKLALFDADFEVRDTQHKGAAAWNDKSDNSIAVSDNAMERTVDDRYWGLVADHEKVHQLEQAATFNRANIEYPGDVVEVNPTLVEWHAITHSNQPMSDLTSDYQSHKQRGDALVSFLGSKQPLLDALKSGDMQSLQDRIEEKMLKIQGETKQPPSFEEAAYVSLA